MPTNAPITYPVVWEAVGPYLRRMRVFEGWLVVYIQNDQSSPPCFVPDKNGDWILG